MLIAYWAAKGGSGTTVVAAAHALHLALSGPTLLVDLAGDLPCVIGSARTDAGVAQWLGAGSQVPADALDRIAVPVTANLHLVCRGAGDLDGSRAEVLAGLLATSPRTVVVDCGTRPDAVGRAVARVADRSILVTRACYVAMRRQSAHEVAPTEIALVREPHRALRADDVAAVVGAPVRTVVPVDPSVSRAVDAGLLRSRFPRALSRALASANRAKAGARR